MLLWSLTRLGGRLGPPWRNTAVSATCMPRKGFSARGVACLLWAAAQQGWELPPKWLRRMLAHMEPLLQSACQP